MSTSYRIDKKTHTIFIKLCGHITFDELVEIGKMILEDPNIEKGYNRYVDFSEAKPGPNSSWEKIKNLKKFVETTQNMRGRCSWSIYAPGEDAYNFSMLFARLTKELGLETRVFRKEQDAKEWLGI